MSTAETHAAPAIERGLVSIRADGNRRLYRADIEGLAGVWQFIDDMWTDHLGRLKLAAEALAPGSTRVEVTLAPDGDDPVLTLRHFDMPATDASDHEKGWKLFVGERLVAAAAAAAAAAGSAG